MGYSSSVQFRDTESVIEAFNNRGVEAWSISQGKQFMFKGIGHDGFESILKTLELGDSSALYTVRIYEDITCDKEIKSNTPDDGSFNFRLNEDMRESYRSIKGFSNPSKDNAVLAKLDAIEKRMDDYEKPGADDSLGIVGKLLDNPVIAGIVPTLVEILVSSITGTKQPAKQFQQFPPQLPHSTPINPGRNAVLNGIDEDRIINEAIAKLKQYDPNLSAHLQKLVEIAEADQRTFTMIINALN